MENVSEVLIDDLYTFLGYENVSYFKHLKGLTGSYAPVLKLNVKRKGIPVHPVHFREGMQIRNWLRSRDECKEWTNEDFEINWTLVIHKVVEKYGNKNFNN